jgi:hypothetical protein
MSRTETGKSFEDVLTPPNTLSPVSDGYKDFRAVFEAHMQSSEKPIKHESTSVLLLSYDSDDKLLTDMDVREEV